MSAPISTAQDTINALLERSRRSEGVPIRKLFVQRREGRAVSPGPLASLVKRKDERGLDLYLLVIAVASSDPWEVHRPAEVWARTLDLASGGKGAATISKIWKRLADHNLIARGRFRHEASVRLLREDGSGAPYEDHPGKLREAYFKLPIEFWTTSEFWCRRLSFAEKTMLLICLSLQDVKDDYILPQEKMPAWYGISADTAGRGLRGLDDKGLLSIRMETKKAPLAPTGQTVDYRYRLQSPFLPKKAPAPKALAGSSIAAEARTT